MSVAGVPWHAPMVGGGVGDAPCVGLGVARVGGCGVFGVGCFVGVVCFLVVPFVVGWGGAKPGWTDPSYLCSGSRCVCVLGCWRACVSSLVPGGGHRFRVVDWRYSAERWVLSAGVTP